MNNMDLFSCIQEHYQNPSMSKYMAMTESEKASVGRTLIDQIYVNIADNYNHIDFGSIPKSNGKISTMKEFDNLKSSILLLEKIAEDSKQKVEEITTLSAALSNLVAFEDNFYMGFVKKNTQIIMTYNLLAMSLYCGTSLMINALVDYVNLANTDTVQVIINKKFSKTNSYLMIQSLDNFNKMVGNGQFKAFLNSAMKPPATMNESVIATSFIVIGSIIGAFKIIPLIKELIYIFFHAKLALSDAAAIQEALVRANIENLKVNGTGNEKMIKVQSWFADKLHQISSAFAIKYEKSEKQARIDISSKLTKDDVVLF